MSDAAFIAVTTAITGIMVALVTSFFGYLNVRANNQIKKTTETTLKHVNHQVIAQARTYAVAARLNAELSQNPGYKKIAEDAEAALAQLVKAQEQIDRGDKGVNVAVEMKAIPVVEPKA